MREDLQHLRRPRPWMAMALATALPAVMLAQAAPAPPAAPGQGAPAGQRGGGPGGPPGGGRGAAATGRSAAPVDLTGYWVSIVTEDWIERMSPESPPSGVINAGPGGFGGGGGRGGRGGGAPVPANPDPCRVYGAGGSMRVPGRLHITWADDNSLKADMSAGTQTRLFRFNVQQPQPGPPSLQGYSVATWEGLGRGGGGFGGFGGGGGGGRGAPAAPRWGSLKVVTTNTTGGYLLTSRNHYSPNAVLTEHFTRHTDFGVDYVTVTAILEDGGQTRITSSTFKKEPDGSKFAPSGCELAP